MAAPTLNFDHYPGNSRTLNVTVTDGSGNVLNLTGLQSATFALTRYDPIRSTFQKTALVTKTLGAGVTVVNAAAGTMSISLVPADTKTLTIGQYYFELEIVDYYSNAETMLTGLMTLLPVLINP